MTPDLMREGAARRAAYEARKAAARAADKEPRGGFGRPLQRQSWPGRRRGSTRGFHLCFAFHL